jgi:hypothetical protein
MNLITVTKVAMPQAHQWIINIYRYLQQFESVCTSSGYECFTNEESITEVSSDPAAH